MARRWVLLIVVLALMASSMAGAQTGGEEFFIQLADTQFGAFNRDRSFDQETAN